MRALFGLNFLRAGAALAVLVGSVGAMVWEVWHPPEEKNPSPGTAFLIFSVPVILTAWLVWSLVNWVLSLASYVRCHQQHGHALAQLATRSDLFVNTSALYVRSARGLGWACSGNLASPVRRLYFLSRLLGVLPGKVVFVGVLLITLLYFAVADLLYLGRLGSYVWIVQGPAIEPIPEIVTPPPICFATC